MTCISTAARNGFSVAHTYSAQGSSATTIPTPCVLRMSWRGRAVCSANPTCATNCVDKPCSTRARHWDKAAGDLREELRLHPNRASPWLLAWVHYQTGDIPGCRRLCLEVLDRFGRGSRYFTLQCQVFLPEVAEDYTEALDFSHLRNLRHPHHRMSRAIHGLVLYRAGQFSECLQWFDVDELTRDQIRANPGNPYPAIMSVLIVAMAHEKLGHTLESRRALKAGTQLLEARSRRADLGNQWHSWIRCRMLRNEAEELLGIPAIAPKRKQDQEEN